MGCHWGPAAASASHWVPGRSGSRRGLLGWQEQEPEAQCGDRQTRPPVFLHHPLLFQAAGQKLSKASHDTGLRELRAGGAGAVVLGEAAFRASLLPRRGPVSAAMLGRLFG